MALTTANYPIAPRGLATSFTESEVPIEYALRFRNRFINAAGGAEKRRGLVTFGNAVQNSPTIDSIHELVKADGTTILFVSDGHSLYRFDDPGWTGVRFNMEGGASSRLRSVQVGSKLIFFNGRERPFYTEEGLTYHELLAVVERGETDAGTDHDSLHEADVTSWVTDTFVAVGDVVYNESISAYGVITAVAAGSVAHTAIGSAGASTGLGTGTAGRNQQSGDRYVIIDTVALNVIPVSADNFDNTAVAAAGTDENSIEVSAVDGNTSWLNYFGDQKIDKGDYIRNTTRSALMKVTAIASASLAVTSVAGQTSGDSLIFYKSAMPVAEEGHVHFKRAYFKDIRPKHAIRVTGPNDPQDMTAEAGTLDASTFPYGAQQPEGDEPLAMISFQRLFAVAGRKSIMLFQGTDPIADVSGASIDFDPIGVFPQGVVSSRALTNIGNDIVYVSPDGAQALSLTGDASIASRQNLSEPIKLTLRDRIALEDAEDVVAFHYPRRSWLCLKIGSELYVYNYTPFFGAESKGVVGEVTDKGSWSVFDGKFARQKAFLVRSNGDLICGGVGGQLYLFDQADTYSDDGETYSTEYQTGWLTMDEPKKNVRIKQGHYIRPVFDVGAEISYTIRAEGGFAGESDESLTVTVSGNPNAKPIGLWTIGTDAIGAAGAPVQEDKLPLRWRGKEVRVTFTTSDQSGPDVLSRFTLYVTPWGAR